MLFLRPAHAVMIYVGLNWRRFFLFFPFVSPVMPTMPRFDIATTNQSNHNSRFYNTFNRIARRLPMSPLLPCVSASVTQKLRAPDCISVPRLGPYLHFALIIPLIPKLYHNRGGPARTHPGFRVLAIPLINGCVCGYGVRLPVWICSPLIIHLVASLQPDNLEPVPGFRCSGTGTRITMVIYPSARYS